jgi:CubicO group peptidase (beta-lactamase class C family)
MTRTQTGDIKTGFVEGMSFGFAVVKQPQGVTSMLSPGTFGHGGAYATQSWADPKRDLILVLMIQRAGFPNGGDSPVRRAFQETINEQKPGTGKALRDSGLRSRSCFNLRLAHSGFRL